MDSVSCRKQTIIQGAAKKKKICQRYRLLIQQDTFKSFCLRDRGRLRNESRPILLKSGTQSHHVDLCTEVDVRCGVKMNVSALLIFVSSLSIMLRPTQAEGEFQNVLTCSTFSGKTDTVFYYLRN